MRIRRAGVTRAEVVAKYNELCPFTGARRLEDETSSGL